LAGGSRDGGLKISSREDLQKWLDSLPPEQERWTAVAMAARTALRVVPLVATDSWDEHRFRFGNFTFAVFFATALARVAAVYPTRAKELRGADATNAKATVYVEATAYTNANAHTNAAKAHTSAAIAVANAAGNAADATAYAAADATTANVYAANAALAGADATLYATKAAIAAAIATDALWSAVSHDADFTASDGAADALASLPLWPDGEPDWSTQSWKRLQKTLPREDDWQVWIDWYNRRLEGVSDPEEIELVFATVPDKEREAGPAAANKWIKERLGELQKRDSPPPHIPRQGPGPHVEIDTETGAVVPAKPESLDAEGNNLARLTAQHPQIVRLAGELLANLGQNE